LRPASADVALNSRTSLIDVITNESRTSRDHGCKRGWRWVDGVDGCLNVRLFMNGRQGWPRPGSHLHWFDDTTTCPICDLFGPLKSARVGSIVQVKIFYLFVYMLTHRSRKC